MIAIWDPYLEGQLPISRNVKGTMASELDSSKVPRYPMVIHLSPVLEMGKFTFCSVDIL